MQTKWVILGLALVFVGIFAYFVAPRVDRPGIDPGQTKAPALTPSEATAPRAAGEELSPGPPDDPVAARRPDPEPDVPASPLAPRTTSGPSTAAAEPAGPGEPAVPRNEPTRRQHDSASSPAAPGGRSAPAAGPAAAAVTAPSGSRPSRGTASTGSTTAGITAIGAAPAAPAAVPAAAADEAAQVAAARDNPPSSPESSPSLTEIPPDPDPGEGEAGRGTDPGETSSIPVVRMTPFSREVSVGDEIAILVDIAGADDVGHVPFHVTYDPRVLRFELGEEGSFLGSDGVQTAFFAAPTSQGNVVVVGLSRLGRGNGIAGSGELCVLRFSAVASGTTAIGFARAKVRDSGNRIVQAVFEPTSITVF